MAPLILRGGIAIGQLYADDDIAFGDSLLEAYEAETHVARDPRIVLASSVLPFVEQQLGFYADPAESPQNKVLLRDVDGQLFVNYLGTLLDEDPEEPRITELAVHKSVVESKLRDHRDQPPLQFVVKYLEDSCNEFLLWR